MSENNHGGSRAGSGRKSGKQMFDQLSMLKRRKIFLKMVSNTDLEKIVSFLIKRATRNTSTAKYVINQLIGKPLQSTDITSGGEKLESYSEKQVRKIAGRIAKGKSKSGSKPGA